MNLKIDTLNLKALNEQYAKLDVYKRVEQLYKDFDAKDIMLTSSFATTSAFLLKVFSDVNNKQKIYFIDTGYHFPETLIYKQYLTQLYDLEVVEVKAASDDHAQTLNTEMWKNNPDKCCSINKVEPLQVIKGNYKIWVSGLMRWQLSSLHF